MKTGKTSKDFEGRSVYERMIAVFFDSNPVEDLNDTVDHEFMGYGTAAHEFFNEKKVLMEIARTQSDQLRNSNIQINRKLVHERSLARGATYLIVEEFDFHDLDIDHHYRMRLSTILEKTDGSWLVTHMHGSTPDSNIAEEEALPMEGLRRKNRELEEKIKEGIREAELEAALERIRSSSLAMQKPDDLGDVVSVLFKQMQGLSVDMGFASVSIFIFEEGSRDFVQWMPLPDGVASLNVPYIDHPISSDLLDAKESGIDYFEKVYSVEEKNAWAEKGFELTDYKDLPDEFKTSLLEAPGYAMSISLAKHSGICIPSFEGELPSPENVAILKRVGKVFEQAYTRFLDLQKAEAQVREAQIEAALERVRSRLMAMHKSEELKEVVKEIFDRLAHLNINAEHAGIVVDYEPKKDWHFWIAETQDIPAKVTVPYLDLVWDQQFTESKREGKHFFTTHLNFDEKNSFYKKLLPHIEGLTEQAKDFYFSCPGLAISTTIEEDIGLYIENFSGTPYSEVENETLKRFGKVFQQAYTRFLDLKKAEAQAREAQIVASLERVRAATMAMHNSEELSSVLSTLFEQFDILDINPSHAVLTLINKEKNTLTFRTTGINGYKVFAEQEVDLTVVDAWLDTAEKWKKSTPNEVNVNEYPPEVLPDVWEVYSDIIFAIPENARPEIKDFPEGLFITEGYCKFGYIGFAHHRKPTDEEKDIVRRIAVEFGTLYQRFLDLQKAEAQAREAEIQLALERVRARTMAMQKSDELGDVIALISEQMDTLQIPVDDGVALITFDEDSKDLNEWMANEGFETATNFHLPYFDHPVLSNLWKAKDQGQKELIQRYSAEESRSFLNHIFQHTDFRHTPEPVKEYCLAAETYATSIAFQKNTAIFINDYSGVSLSDSEMAILHRFAKEFDQTYTRFKDLQKAEIQAKEAQIETALEKVRSRSLAMHKSDELNEVVSVLFEKLKELQIPFTAVGIATRIEGSKDLNAFVCGQNEAGLVITNYRLPYFDNPIPKDLYNALEKQLDPFVGHYSKEEKDSFYEYVIEHTAEFRHLPEDIKRMIFESPTYTITHVAVKNAVFNINDFEGKVLADHEVDIIKRFARVFDQAYTRFLDLQNAEKQAREAQIESALERVRSRSMAMHHSEELAEVASVLYQELVKLGITDFVNCGFVEIDELNKSQNGWNTLPDGSLAEGYFLPLHGEDVLDERYKVWKEQVPLFLQRVGEERLRKHLEFALPTLGSKQVEEMVKANFPDPTYFYCGNFKYGYLSIISGKTYSREDEALMIRFTNSFEQTYTRFLDLKKAENQAREAQIEASLEKVRAQSMGMQGSNDLSNVASVMFDEMKRLGGELFAFGIVLCNKDEDSVEQWHNLGNEGMISPFTVPVDLDYIHRYRYDQWLAGEELFSIEIPSDYINEHFDLMFGLASVKAAMDELAGQGVDVEIPDWEIDYGASFKHGYLLVSSRKPFEESYIFPRFAKVFDQAYTRFLDLKKAEEQAREAEIEVAVERIRSRALAMHEPSEIQKVTVEIRKQLLALGIDGVSATTIHLHLDDGKIGIWDVTEVEESVSKNSFDLFLTVDPDELPSHLWFWRILNRDDAYWINEMNLKELYDGEAWLRTIDEDKANEFKQFLDSGELQHLWQPVVPLRKGKLNIDFTVPPPDEMESILPKLGAAFDLAYKRFEDLQKAEAQARESEIQLALERVRARTMAMKKSDELREAVLVIYEQLEQLHFEATACNIIIMDKESGSMQYWVSGFTQDIYPESYHVPFLNHPYLNAQIEPWKQGEKYAVMEYSGEEKKRFDEIFFSKTGFKNVPEQAKLAMKSLKMAKLSTAYCRYGALQVFGLEPLSEKKGEILRRFAKVFEQTYTRFLDLQKAEAQTREVQIEAALERARAQSMMMQHSDEINTISNAFHEQLNLLGIPSEFSYVWLPDEENQSHQFWASWSEVKAGENSLQSKQVTYPLDKSEPYTAACFAAWANPDAVLEEFIPPSDIAGFFDVWQELLSGAKKLNADFFPDGIYYSEAYMRYGCFGINIRRKLTEEEKNILKRFSKEFERAYTRFLDLQTAEKQALLIRQERDRLEIALNELHATQDQLIQQEKLASLGQLTAGIAHEIKNPLNFVNNFSDVSIELVEEAREEVKNSPLSRGEGDGGAGARGVSDDAQNLSTILEILDDIEANLRKIHEHGSRADGIVKSMLQHSRGGDGKPEPTPLNPLIKEYVNLAFHGMRAGNEPINVDIDLQLADKIGEIPLIAEDFSRVILNICNNGFDAMREKEKMTEDGGPKTGEKSLRQPAEGSDPSADGEQGDDDELSYSPKLSIRTKSDGNTVTIEIEDNGPGIPDDIKDKIMQPFFTTKKGTQGTGLGLSITNDIVKAHRGVLKIATQAGKGTTFIIELPK